MDLTASVTGHVPPALAAAIAVPRPRRVVVASAEVIVRVVDAVRNASPHHAALGDSLLAHLQANVRLQRSEEVTERPPDAALVARVCALEVSAQELGSRARAARTRITPALAAEAERACRIVTDAACANAARLAAETREARALRASMRIASLKKAQSCFSRAKDPRALVGRIAKLKHVASTSKARAENVLETLRIVAENEPESENATITLTLDGDAFAVTRLPNARARGADSEMVAKFTTPPRTPTPPKCSPALGLSPDHLERFKPGRIADSPHITPRSRTRRRLLGNHSPLAFNLPR